METETTASGNGIGDLWQQFLKFLYTPASEQQGSASFNEFGNPTVNAPKDKILGMTPAQFQSVMGGMGAAVGPEGSWQQKLGGLAMSLGNAQLRAEVEKERANASTAVVKDMLKSMKEQTPASMGKLSGMLAGGFKKPSLMSEEEIKQPLTSFGGF